MGLDTFTALLCFFGGSSAGLLGVVSPTFFIPGINDINLAAKGQVKFNGTSGMGFRVISWLIFTAIVVLFNIWYSKKKNLLSNF